jgi:hypothetical protein
MSAFRHSTVLSFGTPMPTRASTENKRPDDEGRRRVGATLSPLYTTRSQPTTLSSPRDGGFAGASGGEGSSAQLLYLAQ